MSVASSAVLPEPLARRTARGPSRLALLFGVLLVTSAAAFALSVVSYVRPIGDGDGLPTFAALHSMRTYAWAFFVVAGVQLVVGVCAAAIAGWILAPARGAAFATVGGALIWLGAAVYGVGIGGWATVYYFASDSSALGTSTASALVDRVNRDTPHMLLVPIGGAVLIAIGSLVLSVGIWRAGTVPRVVILLGAAATVATLALPPSTILGIAAEAVSSVTTAAIGWYAWRPWHGATRRRASAGGA
jgi:hypothetical protein